MSKQPLIDQLNDAISRMLSDADVQLSSGETSVADLVQIAGELRSLPNPDFKARLLAELERNVTMGAKEVIFRPGFRTVTPYLLASEPGYVDFLKNVFDAVETGRTDISPTSFHSEWRIGDSMLMVGVAAGRSMPAGLFLYVPNVDEVFRRALDAGAVQTFPVMEEYGDRFGGVRDQAGNGWVIATHLGANYVKEGRNSVTTALCVAGASRLIDFAKNAFGAQEIQRHEWQNGLYAELKIGDSVVMVSEASNHDWMQPLAAMLYLYVPNVDQLYEQAMRAGAKSIHPPVNQSYGDRSGGVQDEWGNQWYLSTPI